MTFRIDERAMSSRVKQQRLSGPTEPLFCRFRVELIQYDEILVQGGGF